MLEQEPMGMSIVSRVEDKIFVYVGKTYEVSQCKIHLRRSVHPRSIFPFQIAVRETCLLPRLLQKGASLPAGYTVSVLYHMYDEPINEVVKRERISGRHHYIFQHLVPASLCKSALILLYLCNVRVLILLESPDSGASQN